MNRVFRIKRAIAGLLSCMFLMQQASFLPAFSSEITGSVSGNIDTNPINNGNNTQFDIHPDVAHGDFGFKHYTNFNLSQGDIANLIFALKNGGDISKFVNLVDSQININGILNTLLSNGNIGGHAIFVSPQGMVVGASGVLNVGSLTAIAPTQSAYNKYILDSVLSGTLPAGYSNEGNLETLKASDMGNNIKIDGKIIARGDVELVAQRIDIGNKAGGQAGIIAGVNKNFDNANVKLATVEAAGNLFDALVNNDVKNATAFDGKGNIVIKAQSIKEAVNPGLVEKIVIDRNEYLVNDLISEETGNWLDDNLLPQELKDKGVNGSYLTNLLKTTIENSLPSDATNANAHNDTNYAIVNIDNAVLKAANDITIDATSKVDYISGSSVSLVPILGDTYTSALGQKIEAAIAGEKFDFEGARAKAEVNINSGAELTAGNDVTLSSNAVANTIYKSSSRFAPMLDTSEELYYALGSKTVSTVNVNDGAVITSGNNIKLHAQSQNAHSIKIKNPTAVAGATIDKITGLPSLQVLILASETDAETTAAINSGAIINAVNVEVDAVNHSSLSSNIQSLANMTPGTNMGVAVAVSINNSDIDTNAKIDGTINTNGKGNVSVNAQNLHMSSTVAKADVSSDAPKQSMVNKLKFNLLQKVVDKFSGLLDLQGTPLIDTSGLPNASVATVINESQIVTNATIGKNATIHADNVSVNANTIDLTVNNALSNIKVENKSGSGSSGSGASYIPNPGVAVIVNKQDNSTNAVIESGSDNQYAKVTANDTLSVNATTELPRNSGTIEFILNLLQTGADIANLPDDVKGNLKAEFGDDWDIRLLMQGLINPAEEVSTDISNVLYGLKTNVTDSLGLQGFFNNWASTTSSLTEGTGIAASVIDSSVTNDTFATIGDYATVNGGNVLVNAANKTVQYNAAGQIKKLFIPTGGISGENGLGGNVIVENVTNNTEAKIGDNSTITVNGDVDVLSGTENQFLTVVSTGSKATGANGAAISGSVTVQTVDGNTKSSVGKVKNLKAKNLNVKVGDAKLKELAKADDVLFTFGDEIWNDLPTDVNFEPGFDPDLTSPTISNFGGIDPDTGLLTFNDNPVSIKDGISNILISGALSQQSQTSGGGATSSSGGALGASVNVSQFNRNISATIADGANITLTDSLNVLAQSQTQSLNIALAGAFAGGVKVQKPASSDSTASNKALSKVGDVFNKLSSKLSSTSANTSTDANPEISVGDEKYNIDNDGNIVSKGGTSLKDANGNDVKFQGSTGKEASSLDNLDANKGQSNNISLAAAGSVNAQINESTVKAEIGNATINVANNVNVEANQTTKALNVGGGVANAATVGAGAAVNFIQNSNNTNALINGATITYTDKSANNQLNVISEENNDNIQVAIGVGVTKVDSGDANTSVSAGGSFNADVLENSVTSAIDGAVISHNNNGKIDVNVDAENHSAAYKGAGSLAVGIASTGNNSVGAGMSGNLNIINKTTKAEVKNSEINNANNISVSANKDSSKLTEDLISVGVGGTVITGNTNAYTFSGAMATDVVNNEIAAIIDNSTITATGDLDAVANNNFRNTNLAGSLNFSSASNGAGVGVGAIVSVINNNINASIQNKSNVIANSIDINANNKEELSFLAANMGVQTGAGIPVNANGIVNVIQNEVKSSITASVVDSVNAINVLTDYDNLIQGITIVGAISGSGRATLGANVLSNTMLSSNSAQVTGSNVKTKGKLTVSATSDENIDIIPVAAAIAGSATASAAVNVGVNVVKNSTTAKIDAVKDGNTIKASTISSNGIDVIASDNTKSRSRGGTLAATGGTASVGGSILADVYVKNVDAHIDNSLIENGGDIKVQATAENIFGEETPGAITASSLVEKIQNGSYDASTDADFQNWDMTFDAAGAGTAGVSGSIISKTVVNEVNSYIGADTEIKNAGNIDVLASNKTVADVIVGNVAVAGSAAVGGSVFSNVNVSNVSAYIANGAQIGTGSNVGNINVDAESSQLYKSIMFIIGAAGSAAVDGSINSNIVANATNAYIGNGVTINSNGTLTVDATDVMDIESLNLGISAAGGASIGGAVYVDVLANKVNAVVGKDGTDGKKAGEINVGGNVDISADDTQNFKANIALISGSGAVAVDGVAISNTMASDVNAGIENTTVKTSNGQIDVKAENYFNKDKDAVGIGNLFGKDTITSSDVASLMPLVGIVSISGSGGASIGANVIANVISSDINSYVKNSIISSTNGLNVNALSSMNTYDTVLSTSFASVAAVNITGVNNVYSGNTKAIVENSEIENGSLSTTAQDTFNLNTVVFSGAGSVAGAAVTGIENTNLISNNVIAYVINTNILNASTVNVKAINTVNVNDILAAISATGVGAGTTIIPITNVFTGTTEAKIQGQNHLINGATTTVSALSTDNVNSGVVGVSGAGVGAAVGGYAITNVFDNDLRAIIDGANITKAKSTSVNANSDIDILNGLASGGLNAVGAGVLINSLVNVVNNNINSYIANSSISGGSIASSAIQNSYINNNAYFGTATIQGAAAAINSAVNVFNNNMNSYIDNTSVENASTITVAVDSDENIQNTNMGVSAAAVGAGVSAHSVVNVLENTSKAYINAGNNAIKASGAVTVNANDQILLNNKLGLASVAGLGAGVGASVNVNVINNAVLAELLSNTNGQISAGNVEVVADSIIGMDNTAATAAGGIGGIAGNVVINSIGGKVDFSGAGELNNVGINESIAKIDKNTNNIQYEKDGVSKTASYDLQSGQAKDGVKANLNAKVTTNNKNSDGDAVKVSAINTLKGYSDNTFSSNNTSAAVGLGAVNGSVMVTNMKYKTNASISGGEVIANSGNVKVNASSNVNAEVDITDAAVGAVGIQGGVGYFNNSAETIAKAENTKIDTNNDLIISAITNDNINVDVLSVIANIAGGAASIAVADTANNSKALISGNVDIDANNVSVKSSNNSTLVSKLDNKTVQGIGVNVIVNRTKSNAITQALINASGTIDTDKNMDIIASSNGINATSTLSAGTIAGISGNGYIQGAEVNSQFNAGIDNSNITVNNGGKTTIASGVKTSNINEASEMKAEVKSQKSSATLASVDVTELTAKVNAATEAKLNTGKFTTDSLNLSSKMKRAANVGSSSESLGLLTINTLNMKSSVTGSNTITINGDNTIINDAIVALVDDADTNTQMLNAEIKLVGGNLSKSESTINTTTVINLDGTLAMDDMDVTSTVNRDTFNSINSSGKGLVEVNKLQVATSTQGTSNVNVTADAVNSDFDNGLSINAKAVNTAESVFTENNAAVVAVTNNNSGNTLNATNNINLDGANINAKGDLELNAESDNKIAMKRNSKDYGAIVSSVGELYNNVTSNSDINIKGGSNLTADNIAISSKADLGTKEDKNIEYTVYVKTGIGKVDVNIDNEVTQSSNITIDNSTVSAAKNMDLDVESNSKFSQSVDMDGSGFTTDFNSKSILKVTNNNNLNILNNSTLNADTLNVALDSTNTLSNNVDISVSQFGFRDIDGYADAWLTVNNNVNNNGHINTATLAQFDFMKNSINNITQGVNLKVEAAIATAESGGQLRYTVNNKLNVAQGADITSGKDIIANYTNGNHTLSSKMVETKISRLLFGIPIKIVSRFTRLEQSTNNSLVLDGTMAAGSSAKRYMYINRNGEVDISKLEGFMQNEYNVVEAANVSGSDLTADTIESLQKEADKLQKSIDELANNKAQNDALIADYTTKLNEVNDLINSLNSSITADEASNLFRQDLQNVLVGDGENQISQDVFDKVWENAISTNETGKSFSEVLDEQGISGDKKTSLVNSYNTVNANFTESNGVTLYKGVIVCAEDAAQKQEVENSLNDSKNSITASLNNLNKLKENYNNSMNSLTTAKNSITAEIAYLKENPLADLVVDKGAVEFDNLYVPESKIELNGLTREQISSTTGTGIFKTFTPNIKIDNYSNLDLIFKNVSLDNRGLSGLIINGTNYNYLADTNASVNLPDTPGKNVYLVSDSTNGTGIVINNYYDYMNPSLINAVASDIIFNGYISNSGEKLTIWNESGDVIFNSSVTTGSTDVVATQGDVTYKNAGNSFELKSNDRIIAGKNVEINATNIKIDGTVKAGYGDRNLIITEGMLTNLIEDPTTGEKNMVNLGGSDKSPYLNENNNLKVLYKDGKLILFNSKQEGGNVKLTGNVTGNGSVTYTDGYAKITIDNQTDKQLVVNNLDNNRMDGTFVNKGTITNITNQGYDKADTTISSNGNIDVLGVINNGFGYKNGDAVSELVISGNNGVNIAEKLSDTGVLIATINSYGNSKITNTGASVIIDGIMQNTSGNSEITNSGDGGININGTIHNVGDSIVITNNAGKLLVSGIVENNGNNLNVTNNGTGGTEITGNVTGTGKTSKVTVSNTQGDITIASNAEITNDSETTEDNLTVSNTSGSGILAVIGKIFNKNKGNTKVTNIGTGGTKISGTVENTDGNSLISNEGGKLLIDGLVTNSGENLTVSNKGAEGTEISGTVKNTGNILEVTNDAGKLLVSGTVENSGNNLNVTNNGTGGTEITGLVTGSGKASKVSVVNNQGDLTIAKNAEISNNSETSEDNLNVENNSAGLLAILGKIFNRNKGNTIVKNTNSESGIKIANSGEVINTNGRLLVNNDGKQGILVDGLINNKKGVTEINNNNTSSTSGITISTIGRITNNDGTIKISNSGTRFAGIDIDGLITAIKQNIELTNENSNIVIGEYDSNNDNYLTASKGSVKITQTNGDVLNGIEDPDNSSKNQNHDLGNPDKAYKTLIKTGGNLEFNIVNGNIGKDTHSLTGKESGFGINASTRDYTESINVNIAGNISGTATNNGSALVNIRAKNSNLNIGNIVTDGNVMLTAADWKQADEEHPNPSNEPYYHGYSINNVSTDKSKANITGRNISLISSDNIGSNGNSFTYNQLENGSISALAENDLYLSGLGNNDNIWQLIAKRGDMGLDFSGNAVIREITAGGHLKIVSKAASLTIYDLGKISNLLGEDDDILYPHDKILMGSVIPDSIEIHVLDVNPATRVNPDDANSILNIYNAYVRGNNNGNADVILKADNIIAHAYDAPSSPVYNNAHNGFDATLDRTYANDFMDPNSPKDLKASGFNTVGDGDKLVFDIQGVSPDAVKDAGVSVEARNYKSQEVVQTIEIFDNPLGFKETVYKAKDVTLSLNSSEEKSEEYNRGMELSKFYTDYAYVDTKDLNIHMSDAFITNYAEFRNGNRGGEPGGHYISDDYRWSVIVDNDFHRNLVNDYPNMPVTAQLYTKLTGSYALSMGNVIAMETKAPVVHYNPYEVVNLPRTENSFYRLTYKDDKIQKTTTTPDFADIDKSTYKPTKREYIRFEIAEGDGFVKVSDKKYKKGPRIIAINDISRGGLLVTHDGSLKIGEEFVLSLNCHGIDASPEVKVVRVNGNRAGLKFINLDVATANKILYMNMYSADAQKIQTSMR